MDKEEVLEKKEPKEEIKENSGIWHFLNRKNFKSIMNAYFFCQIFFFLLRTFSYSVIIGL